MVEKQIEVLREKLNSMMDSNDFTQEELLRVSEELDILIVASMKQKKINTYKICKEKTG